jgi:PIN domain nuclease of toxin-antitoxin system
MRLYGILPMISVFLPPQKRLSNQQKPNGDEIGISGITLVEMVYLVEKGRIPSHEFSLLARQLADPDSLLREIPVNLEIARTLTQINASQIPDMPDRIIAATGLNLHVPIISRDAKIQLSTIQTIW